MYSVNKGVLGVDTYDLCVNMAVLGVNPVSHIIFHIFMSLLVYSDSCVSPLCEDSVILCDCGHPQCKYGFYGISCIFFFNFSGAGDGANIVHCGVDRGVLSVSMVTRSARWVFLIAVGFYVSSCHNS